MGSRLHALPEGALIGREAELEALRERLRDGARLLTLLGPPGIGKTRLAGELLLRGGIPGAFCDLLDLGEGDALWARVAEGIDVALPGTTPALESIGAALRREGRFLLLLDNCEGVLQALGPAVQRWLRDAPQLRVLATSRAPLQLGAEERFLLSPLDTEAATALLLTRSAQVTPQHSVDAQDPALHALVKSLDGLPLALELCAGRLATMTAAELVARMDARFALLSSRRADLPARQLTLQAAIASAYEPLGRREQEALARCSVFRGSFTLDTAEAVLGGGEAVDAITGLVEGSLIQRSTGEGRLRLLESVRAFAAARLADEPAALAEARKAHAQHFAALSPEALGTLSQERENLLEAHRHALDAIPALAPALALRLDRVLVEQGPFALRVPLLEATLEVCEEGDAGALQLRLGVAKLDRGDFAGAARCFEQAEEAPSPQVRAEARFQRGNTALFSGDFAAAGEHFEAAVSMLASASAGATRFKALHNLAMVVAGQDDTDRAQALYEEALQLCRRLRMHHSEGPILNSLAQLAQQRGELERALSLSEEAIARCEQVGADFFASFARVCRSWMWLEAGDESAARGALDGAAETVEQLGDLRVSGLWAITAALLGAPEQRIVAERALAEAADPSCLDILAVFGPLAGGPADAGAAVAALEARAEAGEVLLSELRCALRAARSTLARRGAERLSVAADGSWFARGDARVDLTRRKAMRRLLVALAEARAERPGEPLDTDALFAAGWPGAAIDPRSALRRVYATIHSLRQLGLGEWLETAGEGYRLRPSVPLMLQ